MKVNVDHFLYHHHIKFQLWWWKSWESWKILRMINNLPWRFIQLIIGYLMKINDPLNSWLSIICFFQPTMRIHRHYLQWDYLFSTMSFIQIMLMNQPESDEFPKVKVLIEKKSPIPLKIHDQSIDGNMNIYQNYIDAEVAPIPVELLPWKFRGLIISIVI